MKMMKDYLNFYLKCDVLSFVDVFEKFRNSCLKNCQRIFESHKIGTYEINKISLSCFDNKTHILDHGFEH